MKFKKKITQQLLLNTYITRNVFSFDKKKPTTQGS